MEEKIILSHIINEDIQLPVINCIHWRALNYVPKCKIGLDASKCLECPSRISHYQNYLNQQNIPYTKPQEVAVPENKSQKSFIEKAKAYMKAEGSQALQGKVDDDVFEKRKNICISCSHLVKAKGDTKDSIGWCGGGCGCSVGNPRAALSQKLYMPTLSCPKGKFGVEKGSGFKVEDAVDSAKGIITSVKNLFEKDK
jgi:hypothetical protein